MGKISKTKWTNFGCAVINNSEEDVERDWQLDSERVSEWQSWESELTTMSLKRLASLGGREAPIVSRRERQRQRSLAELGFVSFVLRAAMREIEVAFICCYFNPTANDLPSVRGWVWGLLTSLLCFFHDLRLAYQWRKIKH